MYLARELLQMQLVEIGQAFGGRDHSTVIHSVDKVQRQMHRDRAFRERVESARQELLARDSRSGACGSCGRSGESSVVGDWDAVVQTATQHLHMR